MTIIQSSYTQISGLRLRAGIFSNDQIRGIYDPFTSVATIGNQFSQVVTYSKFASSCAFSWRSPLFPHHFGKHHYNNNNEHESQYDQRAPQKIRTDIRNIRLLTWNPYFDNGT